MHRTPPRRWLGLAAALLLPLLPAPASAASDPLIPLLTGGQITYAGHVEGDEAFHWKSIPYTPPELYIDYRGTSAGTMDFSASWLVDGRYPGMPTAGPLREAGEPAIDWTTELGSGREQRSQTGAAGKTPVNHTRSCAWRIVQSEPPLAFPMDPGGRAWQLDATLHRDEIEQGCDNETADDAFVGFDVLEQLHALPDEPAKTAREQRPVDLQQSKDCQHPGGVETVSCHNRVNGTATITTECALCVDDLRYEHPDLPGGSWTPVPGEGTFDGNRVRITATLRNATKQSITAPIAIRDLTHGRNLTVEQLPAEVTVGAGQSIELVGEWDSSGYAWEDGPGKPTLEHELALVTPYGGGAKLLRVRPKPALLVHGWNSSAAAWTGFPAFMKAHSPEWVVQPVSTMDTNPESPRSVFDNAQSLGREVRALRESYDADHVDLIAHSMGGLISRAYIHRDVGNARDGKPWVSHLIQLGTPNEGSPCANLVYPIMSGRTTLELTPGYVKETFNRSVVNRKGVPFSVLVGVFMDATCYEPGWGDGVVSTGSAQWQIGDHQAMGIFHTSMTGDAGVFESFVAPRIEVRPGGGSRARLGAQRSAAGEHVGAGSGGRSGRDGAPLGQRAQASRRGTSVPPQLIGTRRSRARAGQLVTLQVSGGRGEVGAVVIAPPGSTSELLDPKGKVAATVQPGTPTAAGTLHTLRAKGSPGRWRVRVRAATAGVVGISATQRGGGPKLAASAKRAKRGKVTVTAKLSGLRSPRVTAVLRGAVGSKPVRLTLRRSGVSYRATTAKKVSGDAGIIVTARGRGNVTRVATTTVR